MKLFYSDTSPYARKCRVLLREFDLLGRVEEIDSHPFQDGEDLLSANPLGRVPCLVMDTGDGLTESMLISAYLNETAPEPWSLTWADKRLEAMATGLLDLAVGRRVEMVRDVEIYSTYWISRRESGIARTLDQLETEAADVTPIGMAGLTIAIALAYLDFRFPESEWRKARPGLTSIFEAWQARASFADTVPPADG